MTLENPTDRQLVENILAGNKGGFAVLVQNTEALVAQIVFKMVRDPEDRKDIAQDIYLKAYRNLSGFKFKAKLSTWIGQIAYNTCVNYLKKKKLLLLDSGEDDGDGDTFETLIHRTTDRRGDDLEAWLRNKELAEILEAELDKLSPLYKTIATLFHKEELSYVEIGEITGLPEGTLKSYLYRARRKLRDNLLLHYKKEDL